jgi:hypothetical protein
MISLYGRLPVWQVMVDPGERIWLQSYIRAVVQAASPAGPDGIRRGRPHALRVLEEPDIIQDYFPEV